MRTRVTVFASLLLLTAALASAQITMTLDDFPMEPGVVVTQLMGPNQLPAGAPGTGLSWDFSGQPAIIPMTTTWDNPAGHPGADSFPDANRVSMGDIVQGYQQLTYYQFVDGDPFILGSVYCTPSDDIIIQATTNGPTMPMPCSYGDEWDFIMTVESGGTTYHDSTHYVVDAWGEMTTSAGTFDCLRMRADITNMEIPGETEFTIHYYWYAANWGEVCATYAGNTDPDPQYDNGTYVYTSTIENWSDVGETPAATAREFALLPVYPNPFNGTATVRVQLDRPADCRLSMLNLLGREVATLTLGTLAPGTHSVPLQASALATGTYLLRLDAEGVGSDVQRVVLLK